VHLEQKNEDLARKNREHESSLEKLSGDYDKHLEAHVVLQTEYEELKTKNMDIIQRMKDEIRGPQLPYDSKCALFLITSNA
jgi:sugar-specific transcriptional regulator TrmB